MVDVEAGFEDEVTGRLHEPFGTAAKDEGSLSATPAVACMRDGGRHVRSESTEDARERVNHDQMPPPTHFGANQL